MANATLNTAQNASFTYAHQITIAPKEPWNKKHTALAKSALQSLFDECERKYILFATQRGIPCTLELSRQNMPLAQLSRELVMNAGDSIIELERTRPAGNGTVIISLACTQSQLVLKVEDNGTGIPENAKLFKKTESGKIGLSGGKGGGLYLLQKTLTTLGGQAGFQRKPQGSMVFYTVPINALIICKATSAAA